MRKFPFPSSEIRLLMTITKSRWNERILSFLKFIIFKPSFISFLLEELRRPSFLPCLFPNKHVEEYRRVSSNTRLIFSRGGRKSRTNDASPARSPARSFPQPRDIIGSNASRQTIREISYRLVAALAPLVTAYSWNALASL